MRHWLIKTEPDVYSFADLMAEIDRTTAWHGVRNYQARNLMREMRVGDRVLVYHSRAEPPHLVGLAVVVREAYPDASAWDPRSPYFDSGCSPAEPRWAMVDVRAEEALPATVSLAELKANARLAAMKVVQKGQRLSVQPVTAEEFAEVLRMAREKAEPPRPPAT